MRSCARAITQCAHHAPMRDEQRFLCAHTRPRAHAPTRPCYHAARSRNALTLSRNAIMLPHNALMRPCAHAPMHPRAHALKRPRAHAPMRPRGHVPTNLLLCSRAHAPTRLCAHAPTHSCDHARRPCAHAFSCDNHAPMRSRAHARMLSHVITRPRDRAPLKRPCAHASPMRPCARALSCDDHAPILRP
jgi:hypothetical protein